jgi:dihydroorotate dehydrogenase (fumarate)
MDLSTSYLGFRLAHPFVAGASPFGHSLDTVKQLEDGGAAALVLHSLFEEQITEALEGRIAQLDPSDPTFARTLAQFPPAEAYALTPTGYAEHVNRVKQLVRIPVIASLNGRTTEAWVRFATVLEQAGADALELNIYDLRADLDLQGTTVEERIFGIVKELKRVVRIPIAVKLPPFFTAFGNVARRLDQAGADGLVLFNRFYQPDIDIDTMDVTPRVELSTSAELLLRLRWVAILHGRVRPSLAMCGGVATPDDGIKAILAGADTVQVVSALLRAGPTYLHVMRQGLESWMEKHGISLIDEMRGRASLKTIGDAAAFERAHYLRTLQSWTAAERSRPGAPTVPSA